MIEEIVGECFLLFCKIGDGLVYVFVRLDIYERYSDLYLLYSLIVFEDNIKVFEFYFVIIFYIE